MKLFFQNIYSRLKEKFPYLATQQSKVVIPLFLLTLALPLTVFLAQQQQELRQHAAANQATITLSQTTVNAGESMTVDWKIAQTEPGSDATPTPIPTNTPTPGSGQTSISEQEKKQIDTWIQKNDLNQYGDSKDTAYTGGTPLFNEATGQAIDRYEYIVSKHPDKPWATSTPVPPTPTTTPAPATSTSTTNCTKYTVYDYGNAGSQRNFRIDIAPDNPIQQMQVTGVGQVTYSITPMQLGQPDRQPVSYTDPTTISIPAGTDRIYIAINLLPNYQDGKIGGNFIDNCGSHSFSFSLSQGAVLSRATTSSSFDLIPKAYAQTTITGAETLQLYSAGASDSAGTPEAVTSEAIGFPLYLNCTPKQESPTGPVKEPPTTPIPSGSCQYQLPATTKAGSYIFRILASDGQTVLGESAVFSVTAPTEEKDCTQAPTSAQDSLGTACKVFKSSCDVPADWTVVQSCPSKKNKRSALPTIPGDLNYDDRIDLPDFSIMLNCFKRGKSCVARKIPADLNGDNTINELDFDVLISNYEKFKQSSQSAVPVIQSTLKPGKKGLNKQPFPRKTK